MRAETGWHHHVKTTVRMGTGTTPPHEDKGEDADGITIQGQKWGWYHHVSTRMKTVTAPLCEDGDGDKTTRWDHHMRTNVRE
jgi:hypothetical protein